MEPTRPTLPKNIRLKGAVACDSLLRLFSLSARLTGDLQSSAVYLAVISASVSAALRDPIVRAKYATDIPLPDHMRRSVSRRAVAESLGLPRETVRRKVAALIGSGHLVIEGDGVRATGPVLEHGENLQFAIDVLRELERTSTAIRRIDDATSDPTPSEEDQNGPPPVA